MIIGVAIRHISTNFIFSLFKPARHHDVIRYIVDDAKFVPYVGEGFEQGFIDMDGNFLNREEALKEVHRSNQILKRKTNPSHLLFSEDLW